MSPLEKDRSEGNVASWKNSAEIEAPKLEVAVIVTILRACWIKIKFSSSYLRSIYGDGGNWSRFTRSGRGPISRGGSQAKCFAVGF